MKNRTVIESKARVEEEEVKEVLTAEGDKGDITEVSMGEGGEWR